MDQDGANHRFLTNGQNLVLTPRFAPNQQTLTYMSYEGNRPRIWLYTIGTGHQEAVGDTGNMSFGTALLARRRDTGLFDQPERHDRHLQDGAAATAM